MKLRTICSPRCVVLAIMAGVYLGFAMALADVLTRWAKYDERSLFVLQTRSLVLLLGLVCVAALVWRLRKGLPEWVISIKWVISIRGWLAVRLALYVLLLTVAAATVADALGLFQESSFLTDRFFANVLLAGLGLWVVLLLIRPGWFAGPLTGIRGMLDIVMFNLAVCLILLEAVLSVWSRVSTAPLFWDLGSARANIERQRVNSPLKNRTHDFLTINSLGYHDTEFFRAEENDFVVALIADSFGLGEVPYDFNFATVAEKRLNGSLGDRYERIAVHNFGIGGIGIPEYAYLLQNEVLETNPHYVLLAIFVGNDIHGLDINEWRRASFMNWSTAIIARRLWILLTEQDEVAAVANIGKEIPENGSQPEFIYNPSLEKPTFSEDFFWT